MKVGGHQTVGGMCVVGGVVAYVWLMAAALVPTTVELVAAFGVPVAAPLAWIGLTAAALAVALGLDRGLSRRR